MKSISCAFFRRPITEGALVVLAAAQDGKNIFELRVDLLARSNPKSASSASTSRQKAALVICSLQPCGKSFR